MQEQAAYPEMTANQVLDVKGHLCLLRLSVSIIMQQLCTLCQKLASWIDNFVQLQRSNTCCRVAYSSQDGHFCNRLLRTKDKSGGDRYIYGIFLSSEGTGLNFIKRHENVLQVQ